MPNCFQLISKETREAEAFQRIDEAICKHFGWECDTVKYAYGWYDAIGFRVACGKSLQQVRDEFSGYVTESLQENAMGEVQYYDRLVQIVDYLSARFTTDAWAEIGRN
jgi:hypothetical protein